VPPQINGQQGFLDFSKRANRSTDISLNLHLDGVQKRGFLPPLLPTIGVVFKNDEVPGGMPASKGISAGGAAGRPSGSINCMLHTPPGELGASNLRLPPL
jgi:hypothetical protein